MKKVLVKMLKTVKGSDRNANGIAMPVGFYFEGKEYEVGESLAKAFVDDLKVAKKHEPIKKKPKSHEVEKRSVFDEIKTKDLGQSPENK